MAQGDLRAGTFSGVANSITNPFAASGSQAVSVGDLVFAVLCQQTGLTVTAVDDNLGNTYSAVNAGTDAGSITGRMFYSRVTTAGTLTSLSATTTASANNVAFIGGVIEGPFITSPLDAAPANNNNTDNASPFTCPATGTLSQAQEVVIAWMCGQSNAVWAATSPNLFVEQGISQSVADAVLGYQEVNATTSVAPEFTGTNPTASVQGTASFMLDTAQTVSPSLFTNVHSFFAPTLLSEVTITPSLFTNTNTFFAPTIDANTQTLTPGLFTNEQTFFAPTITTENTITPSLFTNSISFFAPSLTSEYTITPSLFTNSTLFFQPQVEAEGGAVASGGEFMVVIHRRRR